MSSRNLKVYRRTEELMYKVYPRIVNFPNAEKFSLCQEIKINFIQKLIRTNDYIYLDNKGRLRVDNTKIKKEA